MPSPKCDSPAPDGEVVANVAAALAVAARLGFPLAVKPLDANQGRGVTTRIASEHALLDAFHRALVHSRRVVVERYVAGRDYRILVVNGDIVAVAERLPAHVIGDGESTLATLILRANADPRRGVGHEKPLTRLTIDTAVEAVLARARLTTASVPAAGQTVVLRDTANLSTGGEAIDRTDEIHPDNAALLRRAAATIGLDVAGIDLVCADISQPVTRHNGAIVEVNAAPGFRMHIAPTKGRHRRVAEPVIRMLFPSGAGRIPVISITGTNGKSTTARMVAHILRHAGLRVGLACTSGVYVNDAILWKGDASGPKSARMILADPTVDVAVLETARGGILREGLAFDRCDVGAVLNVTADHLGIGGIETVADLAAVKSVVTESVTRRGASVLNWDDRLTRGMARHARGRVCYFTSAGEIDAGLHAHIEAGGSAALLEKRFGQTMLVMYRDGRRAAIMDVADIPATHAGAAVFNVQNALAAAMICAARGISHDVIRQALAAFGSSYEQNPGRLNVSDVHGFRVIVDYAHNPAALQAMIDLIERQSARYNRLLASISTPGDRRDDDIRRMGQIAMGCFDHVVFRERPDTRGRRPGEVMSLLCEGAIAAGAARDRYVCIAHERHATSACLTRARPGDLVLLTPTDIEGTWAQALAFQPAFASERAHAI